MPEHYPVLYRREGAHAAEDDYPRGELARRLAVRDEGRGGFWVFDRPEEFWAWQAARPEAQRCFHEVVHGDAAQLLKLDLDAPEAALAAAACGTAAAEEPPAEQAAWALAQVLDRLLDVLHGLYLESDGLCLGREDLLVYDSSGSSGSSGSCGSSGSSGSSGSCGSSGSSTYKASFHVLLPAVALADHREGQHITELLLEALPPGLRPLVDPQVNKRLQGFRLFGSQKPGSGRPKRLLAPALRARLGTSPAPGELFVAAGPAVRLLPPRAASREPAAETALADGIAAELAAAALAALPAEYRAAHAFLEARGGLLLFRRLAPSACGLCRRRHENDNTLMVQLRPVAAEAGAEAGAEEVELRELCRHCPGAARPLLRRAVPPGTLRQREGGAPCELLARELAEVQAGRSRPPPSPYEALPAEARHVYEAEAMEPYERVPTLAVCAQMGLGKTRALRAYIDRHYGREASAANGVIRFVTFRRTFSAALKGQFPEFVHYAERRGDLSELECPRLIVQVESLHRLQLGPRPEPPSLVVLDEAESVLEQFSSGLHRYFAEDFAAFAWLLAQAEHLICLDANLGPRSWNVLRRMRPGPLFFHWNRLPRAAGDRYFFTAQRDLWCAALLRDLAAGLRLVLPTNSLAEAEGLLRLVQARAPQRRAVLYSSRSDGEEKQRHFADVNRHWRDYDVVIYTPTVSAGISFEEAGFDCLYGFFSDRSCPVETCRQMLGRVRQLRERRYVLCLQAAPREHAGLPVTAEEVALQLGRRRLALLREPGAAAAALPEPGGPLYTSPFYHLWVENLVAANRSRRAFVRLFLQQVAACGAALALLPAEPALEAAAPAAGEARLEARRAALEAACAAVAGARDIGRAEALALRDAAREGGLLAEADRLACEKQQLRHAYGWGPDRPLDAAFVQAYGGRGVQQVYGALCLLGGGPTPAAALERLRQDEGAMHRNCMGGGERGEQADLLHRYGYQAHRLVMRALAYCGYVCITDPAWRGSEALRRRLTAEPAQLQELLAGLALEFGLPRPPAADLAGRAGREARLVQQSLSLINRALRGLYGRELRPRMGGYCLALAPAGAQLPLRRPGEPDDAEGRPAVLWRNPPVPRLPVLEFVEEAAAACAESF